jgi:glycosyltransferase involved in cell wall biosynthesis
MMAKPQPVSDVCLLLEGTYPYVPGGVSSWVDQIVRGMPDLTFSLFYLGNQKALRGTPHYKLPENVISLSEVYLYDKLTPAESKPGRPSKELTAPFYETLRNFLNGDDDAVRISKFWELIQCLDATEGKYTFGNLCKDFEAWELQLQLYNKLAPTESFIDFFWTTRFLPLPVWHLLMGRHQLPAARVYHSVTTGYSGLIGAVAARKFNAPYLITEHGIYNNERLAEISRADWIYEAENTTFRYSEGLSVFKRLWVEFFFFLSRVAYGSADLVFALYQGNAALQIGYGAATAKMEVLPNGIDPNKFDDALRKRAKRMSTPSETKVVGFIGRVVTIKDVKTLIRAARILIQKVPGAVIQIIGPTGEDQEYFEECQGMVTEFGLEKVVLFLGSQNILKVLDQLDVMILTSLSEGLPLVILEAFSAGIPVVATDVGACRELIHGRTPEDQALGPAGIITKASSPAETAAALEKLITSPALLRDMAIAGRLRTERYYTQKALLARYHQVYTDHSWSPMKPLPPTN